MEIRKKREMQWKLEKNNMKCNGIGKKKAKWNGIYISATVRLVQSAMFL